MRYLLLLSVLLLTCTPSDEVPGRLHPIGPEEMIRRAYRFEYPLTDSITLRNEAGQVIGMDSLMKISDPTVFALDYFANDSGRIVEAHLRPATPADRSFQQRLMQAANTGPELGRVPIDCADKVALLQSVFDRDQASRRAGTVDRRTDHENLETIISFLDKCGVPSRTEVNEEQMAAIWATLQHGDSTTRRAYLPMLEAAADRGDLAQGTIATMRDRLLVEQGLPQRYGTQVGTDPATGEPFLHPIEDPTNVDSLRATLGMPPLGDYLQRWNLTFDQY